MTQSATVDREQLAALQVLRVRFGDVEVLEVRPSTPPPPGPAVQSSLLEASTPAWTEPGHPGICPFCGSTHVRWTWKPDQVPTSESVRCYGCDWRESRPYIPRSNP